MKKRKNQLKDKKRKLICCYQKMVATARENVLVESVLVETTGKSVQQPVHVLLDDVSIGKFVKTMIL